MRAIPLPPVAKHKGATILTPPHELVVSIFDSLGTAVPVPTEEVMRKMMPVTGLMGQFYAMQRATQAWVQGQGVPAEDAAKYVGAIFHCVTYDTAEAGVDTFDHLVKEQTPGGINEQVCVLFPHFAQRWSLRGIASLCSANSSPRLMYSV